MEKNTQPSIESKNDLQYIAQIVVIYLVIITCITNLSMSNGDSNLWTALLGIRNSGGVSMVRSPPQLLSE